MTIGTTRVDPQRIPETDGANKRDKSGSELTETLISEDSSHHGSTPLDSCEFACDDGGKWVISTNAGSENDAPEYHNAENVKRWASCGKSETERSNDHDDQFDTVHLLSTTIER